MLTDGPLTASVRGSRAPPRFFGRLNGVPAEQILNRYETDMMTDMMERSATRAFCSILQHSASCLRHVATDIRWRIGYKTCFETLVVQQDFSLRTVGMPAYEDDPRAERFHLFRKYGEMLSLKLG